MRERDVENYLVKRIRQQGGEAYKFTSPARRGVPDRLVCLGDGRVVFVELKAPGKKPTGNQYREHAKLRQLGLDVFVIDTKGGVDQLVAELMA